MPYIVQPVLLSPAPAPEWSWAYLEWPCCVSIKPTLACGREWGCAVCGRTGRFLRNSRTPTVLAGNAIDRCTLVSSAKHLREASVGHVVRQCNVALQRDASRGVYPLVLDVVPQRPRRACVDADCELAVLLDEAQLDGLIEAFSSLAVPLPLKCFRTAPSTALGTVSESIAC
jgi:hypothetical protein